MLGGLVPLRPSPMDSDFLGIRFCGHANSEVAQPDEIWEPVLRMKHAMRSKLKTKYDARTVSITEFGPPTKTGCGRIAVCHLSLSPKAQRVPVRNLCPPVPKAERAGCKEEHKPGK